MAMILWPTTLFPANLVSVVESHKAFAVSPMQCERVIQSVRLLRRRRNLVDDEANPVASFGIDNKRKTIQVKQCVKSGIVLPHIPNYVISSS